MQTVFYNDTRQFCWFDLKIDLKNTLALYQNTRQILLLRQEECTGNHNKTLAFRIKITWLRYKLCNLPPEESLSFSITFLAIILTASVNAEDT